MNNMNIYRCLLFKLNKLKKNQIIVGKIQFMFENKKKWYTYIYMLN